MRATAACLKLASCCKLQLKLQHFCCCCFSLVSVRRLMKGSSVECCRLTGSSLGLPPWPRHMEHGNFCCFLSALLMLYAFRSLWSPFCRTTTHAIHSTLHSQVADDDDTDTNCDGSSSSSSSNPVATPNCDKPCKTTGRTAVSTAIGLHKEGY